MTTDQLIKALVTITLVEMMVTTGLGRRSDRSPRGT